MASLVVPSVGTRVFFREVVDLNFFRAALGPPLSALILVISDLFLFLGIHRNHWLPSPLKSTNLGVEVLELRIPVRMTTTFADLSIGLQAIAEAIQQPGH